MKIKKVLLSFIFLIIILVTQSMAAFNTTTIYAMDVNGELDGYIGKMTQTEIDEWRKEIDALTKYDKTNEDFWLSVLDKLADRERELNSENEGKITDDEAEEMMDDDYDQIKKWLNEHDPSILPSDLKEKWRETIRNSDASDDEKERYEGRLDGESIEDQNEDERDQANGGSADEVLYKKPTVVESGDSSQSLDDMMSDGDDFVQSATDNPIDTAQLQSVSSNLFNIFVEVGVALAVIIGLVIGIKYMYSSVDQKAEIKKLLVPYLVGCVVIFGALGIWKFVVTLLQTV